MVAGAFSGDLGNLLQKAAKIPAEQIQVQLTQNKAKAKVSVMTRIGRIQLGSATGESILNGWHDEQGILDQFPSSMPERGRIFIEDKVYLASAVENSLGVRVTLTPAAILREPSSLFDMGCSPSHVKMIDTILRRPQGLVVLAGKNKAACASMLIAACDLLYQQDPNCEILALEDAGEQYTALPEHVVVSRNNCTRSAVAHAIDQQPDTLILPSVEKPGMAGWIKEAIHRGIRVMLTIPASSVFDVPKYLSDAGIDYESQAQHSFYSGLIYQREVPRLCPHCSLQTLVGELPADLQQRIRIAARLSDDEILMLKNEDGCNLCTPYHPGFSGVTTCTEALIPDPEILDRIREGNITAAKQHWRSTHDSSDFENFHGRSAFEHALDKLRRGTLSPQSVESAFGPMDIPSHFSDNVAQACEFGKVCAQGDNDARY